VGTPAFCKACGAPITLSHEPAQYKQVTVLFANVVRSMDIASTMLAERLREIMTELFSRSASVVRRYGGTPLAATACAPTLLRCSKSLAALDGYRHAMTSAVDGEAGSVPVANMVQPSTW
jgi:class 3 adenylate cyclase